MRYSKSVVSAPVLSALCGLLALAPHAGAAGWNELSEGDLSGNRTSPTLINLDAGFNPIFATTTGGDQEYVRLRVPAGARIESLFLRSYAGNDGVAFIAIQEGTTFTEDPSAPNPGNLLGYTHFGTGSGNVGVNLLPAMGTPPLTGSNYTLWIQQLGPATTYQLDVVATPEPAGAAVVATVMGFVCLRRRRRPARF